MSVYVYIHCPPNNFIVNQVVLEKSRYHKDSWEGHAYNIRLCL